MLDSKGSSMTHKATGLELPIEREQGVFWVTGEMQEECVETRVIPVGTEAAEDGAQETAGPDPVVKFSDEVEIREYDPNEHESDEALVPVAQLIPVLPSPDEVAKNGLTH